MKKNIIGVLETEVLIQGRIAPSALMASFAPTLMLPHFVTSALMRFLSWICLRRYVCCI